MIFSAQQEFSNNQAVTATAISTNVIDLGAPGTPFGAAAPLRRDIGKGNEVAVLAQVTTAFATLTSLTVTLETSDNSDLSSPTVLATSVAVLAADLVPGKRLTLRVLPEGVTGRYLGLRYTVAGSSATSGNIQAGIVTGVQSNLVAGG